MTLTAEDLFTNGIERYKNGEPVAELIPVFKELCDRAPKSSPAWTCLSWLYLLSDKNEAAYKAAHKAVKLNPQDPQARLNVAIAMLETGKKGIRDHIDAAQQLVTVSQELREEVEESIADGFKRKPEWKTLKRVQDWIFAAE
ncbi:MAG: hypothetical protein HC771_25385 [Synechococcales cyanobacterium CRU_2_2]|nr:hypothetical protein [Synechococcales cyanobacterium CRU_2_2]